VARTQITSPVRGTIKQLKITTIGGIVPLDDKLLIESEVRPADIAFLRPGQKATIKSNTSGKAGGLKTVNRSKRADSLSTQGCKGN
ncbi:hypothetical protein BROOK1789C_488, partial [Bathymodiolus brooksi thiotrophic gill symbiont]